MKRQPTGVKVLVELDGTITDAGSVTSSSRRCQLAGCSGRRIATRWPDGKVTYPCSKGMKWDERRNAWIVSRTSE